MKTLSILLAYFLFLSLYPLRGDEAGAKELIEGYQNELDRWTAKVNAANGPEARRELWEIAPNPNDFGEKLLRQLDGSWNQDWFLKYAPQLLQFAPVYSITPVPNAPDKTPLSVVRDSADRFHFNNPLIGQLCLALVIDPGPSTRVFVEKVEATHPDRKVQGQAAMALALLSQQLGDGGKVAQFRKQRLDWVRKAIIESADVKVGRTTVGEMAEAFLFSTTNLEKGMVAPDILGRNAEEKAMRLSDNKGKPVMIIFWHSRMKAADETMTFMRKVEERLGKRGMALLGVAAESKSTLREMIKDGSVTWQNWLDGQGEIAKLYQIVDYPACWVLDAEGKVEFRGVPGPFAELTAEALVKDLEKK